MKRRPTLRMLVALFLMLAVLVICISPTVDLPETALRSSQAALRLALAIIAIATAVTATLLPLLTLQWLPNSRSDLAPTIPSLESILPLLC
jgi:hypothetical protein